MRSVRLSVEALFFKPGQLRRQASDLGIQFVDALFVVGLDGFELLHRTMSKGVVDETGEGGLF